MIGDHPEKAINSVKRHSQNYDEWFKGFTQAAWDQLKHHVEGFKEAVEKGDDPFALFRSIAFYARNKRPMPEWLADAFLKAYESVLTAKVGSWDDAFGRPYKKGTQLAAIRRRRVLHDKVWHAVNEIMEAEPDTAIDQELFATVATKLGIGTTRAKKLYYLFPKPLRPVPRKS